MITRPFPRSISLAACAPLALACGGVESPDGAGAAADVPIWALSETPDFSVSESPGPPAFQLYRATSAAILDDGTIVVANNGTNELAYFDSTGTVLRVAGGEGDGPGEFSRLSSVVAAGQTVAAFEQRGRVSLFTAGGEFTGSFVLQAPPVRNAAGYIAGEGLVSVVYRSDEGEPRVYQVWNETGEMTREAHGPPEPLEARVTYTTTPSPGMLESLPSGAVVPDELTVTTLLPRECVPYPYQAVVGREVFAITPGGAVVAVDLGGAMREVYRAPDPPMATTAAYDSVLVGLDAGGVGPPEDLVLDVLTRLIPIGSPMPPWGGDMFPDPTGRLWLERAACPGGDPETAYEIIDLEGNLLATLTLPDRIALRAVRGDRVLVIRRDELSVEHLELYRVVDGTSPP